MMSTETDCPFCQLCQGTKSDALITQTDEIVYEDEHTIAFIACDWWPNNTGSVLVIPKKHFENLYSIEDELVGKTYQTVKKIAKAVKVVYKCDGISTRQHNEPDADQTVFHFHVHVFPRYKNDNHYITYNEWFRAKYEDRIKFAEKLKDYFKDT